MLQLLYLPVLASVLVLYFRIADRLNIIDKPNHRSSHKVITIRGGGIIFPIALLIHFIFNGFELSYFMSGLLLISLVSFTDDIRPLSGKIRILGHITAVSLLFYQAELFTYPVWIILTGYIIIIGTINAYNFMDGINGITGSYSLGVTLSLWFVNESFPFVNHQWIVVTACALLAFNFFNFRKNARCFAGDVGSVSIAFIILFYILLLIMGTGELKYIGFLLLYGLDSISTIVFRLIRKENIFEAHRSHFYQYLANELHWSHLKVSGLYMLIQLFLNVIIIQFEMDWVQLLVFFVASGISFVGLRFLIEGKKVLFEKELNSDFQ